MGGADVSCNNGLGTEGASGVLTVVNEVLAIHCHNGLAILWAIRGDNLSDLSLGIVGEDCGFCVFRKVTC